MMKEQGRLIIDSAIKEVTIEILVWVATSTGRGWGWGELVM